MKQIYSILVCLCMLAGFVACEKDPEFVITTLSVSNEEITPSYNSAMVSCTLKADASISEAFVHYALTADFADYEVAKMTVEKSVYSARLIDLLDNTTYYIRYEASNKYSGAITQSASEYKTLQCTVPTIVLDSIADVWENSAKAYLHLTFDGGASVTERGVVYSTNPNPTTADNKVSNGSGTGSFTCNLTNLQPNTTYYVRAYAVNSVGTAYGEQVTFTTNKQIVLPTVTTSTITQITETTAVAGGNVTSDGNASVTERGVVYSTNQNPTTADNKVVGGSGTGSFTCDLTNLQPNTTYYVRAYATNSVGTAYGEVVSFTIEEVRVSDPTGTENGYGYVDLGLSVKWATMNVGASKLEDYGDYFAWGEKQTKSDHDWITYTWCNGSYNTLTKYCSDSNYGTVDNKTILEAADDAATANWGGSWRMPTKAEQDELREQCTWTWITQNGVNGYKVTSKSNGNSIFLPAAGYYRLGGSLDYTGSYGCYWSSSLDTDNPYNARYVRFGSSDVNRDSIYRCYGLSVRPVYDSRVEVQLPTLTTSAVTQITETTAVAGGNVTSDGNASVTERGVCIATVSNPTTSNTKITSGSGTGSFTCNLTNLQPNTTYYVRAYAVNSKGTAYGTQVTFTTQEQSSSGNGTDGTHEYIDLGLSVKWATCNVGAESPEDYGDPFAWGETQPKETYYIWSTYKWCNGSSTTLTKYNTSSSYGSVDDKTVLEASDDAATANWGGAWRMPTDAEFTELREQCTWTWTTQNGVNGYKVTSKSNGNSIFLPTEGNRDDSSLSSAGSYGYYWSSSLNADYPPNAWCVRFDSSYVYRYDYRRDGALSVRPVYQGIWIQGGTGNNFMD